MSGSRKKDAFGSPMDDVLISWATPRDTQKNEEPACKRKCDDDSGYASCSSVSKSVSKILAITPEVSGVRFNENEAVYTPCVKQSPQVAKKRIFNKIEDSSANYNCTLPVVDSYSDFLSDASLYNEPMDICERDSNLCVINEEPDSNLGVTEISKKIDVNLEIDPCSTPGKTFSPKKRSRVLFKKRSPRIHSLYGFENVDFLFQLGVRKNYSLIVSKILSYLSDSDLSNITMVSNTWRNICLRDATARHRWFQHVEYLKASKENLNLVRHKLKRSLTPLGNANINHSTPLEVKQPKSPPVSPSKFRFRLFQKEAQTLKEDEMLMECPRCSRPSACSPSTLIGECRGIACMLKFCTVCRTPAHDQSPCPYLTPVTPTKKKHTTIGSKESKRFLRRL